MTAKWEYHAKLSGSENHRGYTIVADGVRVADVMPIDEDGVAGKEYARRIAACVNACAGLQTEHLEADVLREGIGGLIAERDHYKEESATLRTALHTQAEESAKLIEQRDGLLAAAKAIMETEFAEMACIGSHASAEHALGLLAAAIDKATN